MCSGKTSSNLSAASFNLEEGYSSPSPSSPFSSPSSLSPSPSSPSSSSSSPSSSSSSILKFFVGL